MSFNRYARALIKKEEIKSLKRLYFSRFFLPIAAILLNIVISLFSTLFLFLLIRESYMADLAGSEGQIQPQISLVVVGLLIFAESIAISLFIAFIVVSVKFPAKMKEICLRRDEDGLSPEIVEYRKELADYMEARKKATGWAFFLMIACIFAAYVLSASSAFFKFYALSVISPLLIYLGIIIFLLANAIRVIKERKRLIKTENDQILTCLYPVPDLFDRAKLLKKKSRKRRVVFFVTAAAAILAILFLDFRFFAMNYFKYLLAALLIILYLCEHFVFLPLEKERRALNEKTEETLASNESFAPNKAAFDNYKNYLKHERITTLASRFVSAAAGIVIALFGRITSFFLCVAIVAVGLIVKAILYFELRNSVLPIERQINESFAKEPTSSTEE